MISVKDKEVVAKRENFLRTIQMHREKAKNNQSSMFISKKARFEYKNREDDLEGDATQPEVSRQVTRKDMLNQHSGSIGVLNQTMSSMHKLSLK